MKYQRPELVPLGSATVLIQGSKVSINSESEEPTNQSKPADSELDD
jgi:hypothetical protein